MTKSQSAILIRVFGISAIMLILGGLMIFWDNPRSSTPYTRSPSTKDSVTRPVNVPTSSNVKTTTQRDTSTEPVGYITIRPNPNQSETSRQSKVKNEPRTPTQGQTAREYEEFLRKRPLVVNPVPEQSNGTNPVTNRQGSIPPDFCKTPTLPTAKSLGDILSPKRPNNYQQAVDAQLRKLGKGAQDFWKNADQSADKFQEWEQDRHKNNRR